MKPAELTYWTAPYPQTREHADAIRRALRGETPSVDMTTGTFANGDAKPLTLKDVEETMRALKARASYADLNFGEFDHAETETKEKR